jgi:EF-P beta-lysylation protein EpmB
MPQIITRIDTDLHCSWQKELANVVTDPKQLLEMLELDADLYKQHFSVRKLFPVRVPRPFIARMTKGDINDPLLKQVMPNQAENKIVPGYVTDPLEEHDTVAEGLLHKYNNRVLMIVKAGCAVNCRYCFRRHFPYADNSPNKQRWQPALNYINEHPEINEVIFSGGDPLMASDQHLAWLVSELEKIPHLSRIRIHSRLPVVIPERISEELIELFKSSRLAIILVLHINHANEIDEQLKKQCLRLHEQGIRLYNQSVLLRGINDSGSQLAHLSEKLFECYIQPYYLHLFDPVQGAAHFDVSEQQAQIIYQQLLTLLPGFLVPKLVRETAGEPSKTPIMARITEPTQA